MLTAITLFLANAWGWIIAHWRLVMWVAVALFVFIGIVLFVRECGHKTPKLNQKEIIQAQQAIEKNDREEMTRVLVQSDAREKVADETAVNAANATVNAIAESKKKWSEASTDEMAAELERRAKESK